MKNLHQLGEVGSTKNDRDTRKAKRLCILSMHRPILLVECGVAYSEVWPSVGLN